MNEQTSESLTVVIGDQSVRVRIPVGERERYLRLAAEVNRVLKEILEGGVMGAPRALAMTAFQLAMELEESREALKRAEESRERLGQLIRRIDTATTPPPEQP